VVDVMRGRLALVGNPPLEETVAETLDAALVDRWLDVPAGLFGLAQIEWLGRSGRIDSDDVAAAAAMYAGSRTLMRDVGYVVRGLGMLLTPRNWRGSGLVRGNDQPASPASVAAIPAPHRD
jgi:lipopolysaccharide/colanic/teichoic acid biosynthesis glycosyltransferase